MTILGLAGYLLFLLAMLGGVALVPLGLPGIWLIVGTGLVYGLATDFASISIRLLLLAAALALVGEILEFGLGAAAARWSGASRWGMGGALLGGIGGAVLLVPVAPPIGSILGAFVGAFLGAVAAEKIRGRPWPGAYRAGMGAFLGSAAARMIKLVLAVSIAVLLAWRAGGAVFS